MNRRYRSLLMRRCKCPHTIVLCVAALLFPWAVQAQQNQAWLPEKGHGAFSVGYQDLHIAYHTDSHGNKLVPGTIDDRSLFLNLDYGLTDKLALSVGLPYKSNRFVGPGTHNPCRRFVDCHGQHNIDDQHYHGSWGNWDLGLRYQWRSEPWAITPYISYGVPSHDYTTFAHAAVGTGQRRLELGVNVGHRFAAPLQNLYFQASYGYSFMQVFDHRHVNHSTLNLELGYYFTPRLTARLLMVGQKTHNGLNFPQDYPRGQTDEHFFAHDENLRDDYVNIIGGVNYQLNDHFALFGSYGHTIWGENTHLIDHAITFGISRSF